MNEGLSALQKCLKHEFADASLLIRALTHRSYSVSHNERLEFLGDSVLGVIVADMLYQRLQNLPEGDLSRVRANLVKQDTLHQLAVSLGLPDVILLGEGEMRSGGQRRPSILADALEAVIGAVYLDAGFQAVQALVQRLYQGVEINQSMDAIGKDPKTALQELLQGRRMNVPAYKVVATQGLAHKQTFDVECKVPELQLSARGTGSSRRAAEQIAATGMLQILKFGDKS